MSDYDALLNSEGIPHTTEVPRSIDAGTRLGADRARRAEPGQPEPDDVPVARRDGGRQAPSNVRSTSPGYGTVVKRGVLPAGPSPCQIGTALAARNGRDRKPSASARYPGLSPVSPGAPCPACHARGGGWSFPSRSRLRDHWNHAGSAFRGPPPVNAEGDLEWFWNARPPAIAKVHLPHRSLRPDEIRG